MREFLQANAVHADYAWFVAASGWALVGWLVWRGRHTRSAREAWLAWAVAGGFVTALLEITFSSLSFVENGQPRLTRSIQLGLAGGFLAIGFARSLAANSFRRQTLTGAVMLIFLLCAGLRWQQSAFASVVECGLTSVLAVTWYRSQPKGRAARTPWAMVAVLAGWIGTAGPLAGWTQEEAHWVDSSLWTWPAALVQASAAIGLAVSLARSTFEDPARRRMIKVTAYGLGAWLVAGFAIAWAASRLAENTFRESAKSRVQTAALLLDGDALGAITGPSLHFDERRKNTTTEGWISELWLASRLENPDTQPFREQLRKIRRANPDVRYVDFSIAREGSLVAVLFPSDAPGPRNVAAWQRPISAEHTLSRMTGEPVFEGPLRNAWGTMVHALAPVKNSRGQTVGWLVLQWGSAAWAATQLHARLLAFAVLGAGVVIGLLGLGRRLAALEKSSALQRVAVATAEIAAQTTFLAKVSHELRTPLQGILGYTRLLAETSEDPVASRHLRQLTGEAEHLQRLVEDLLDLSAVQAGGFRLVEQPHDIRRLVADTVESFEARAAQQGLFLHQQVDGNGSGWALVDVMRVRQVLLNLLSNALKFTRQGGITVRLNLRPSGDLVLIEIAVTDTGPGIAAADVNRLFKPFSRLENHHGENGTGLGLALSSTLCQQMGGTLSVESDGMNGSTFRLCLPLKSARPGLAEKKPAASVTPVRGRVLIVDDHPAVRELYQEWLTNAGAACLTAASAEEARTLLARHQVDAVILDLSIGHHDGAALAAEWRQTGSASPAALRIVGVSAHAAAADRERALRAGMDAFFLKPIARAELLAALHLGADHAGTTPELPAGLRQKFQAQLAADWERLHAETSDAIRTHDWPRIASNAHYLKNSADVLAHHGLQLSCARLEAAAGDQNPTETAHAFTELIEHFMRLNPGRHTHQLHP